MIHRLEKGVPDVDLAEARLHLRSLRERVKVAEEIYQRMLEQDDCHHQWGHEGEKEGFFDMTLHYYRCRLCGAESFGRSPEYYND